MILYKYTRARHIPSILGLRRFAFPRVAELNDPFESSVDATLRELRSDYRKDYKVLPYHARQPVVKYRIGHMWDVGVNPSFDPHNENIDLHNAEIEEQNRQFQRLNEQLGEGIDLLERFRSDVGVLSLTRDSTNVVMWAHYAENSSGVCIGIDSAHSFFTDYCPAKTEFAKHAALFQIAPVLYEPRPPDYSADSPSGYVRKAFFTKYKKWAYEDEMRLLRPIGESPTTAPVSLFELPIKAIREVIVGNRASDSTRELVDTLASNMPHVRLLLAEVPKNEYAIRLRVLIDAEREAQPDSRPRGSIKSAP